MHRHSCRDIQNLFWNDIYGSYLIDLLFDQDKEIDSSLQKFFMTIIHPASAKDVEKYLEHSVVMVNETFELYQRFTAPYIKRQLDQLGHLQWLYNIVDGKAECDRKIYEDDEFLIVKDLKWRNNTDQLSAIEKKEIYLNAIVKRRDLHSLRDLTQEHLKILERIDTKGREVIANRYSINEKELRVFLHYQPSFYHLHIHFNHIKNEHHGFQCERAHLLSAVIENIRLVPDYYQKVSIEFPLSDASELKFY